MFCVRLDHNFINPCQLHALGMNNNKWYGVKTKTTITVGICSIYSITHYCKINVSRTKYHNIPVSLNFL